MSFLAGLGAKLIEYLIGDFVAWAAQKISVYKARKAIEDAAKKSVENLKAAKTAKEVDDASDSSLDGV